jgi:hypothetical protein
MFGDLKVCSKEESKNKCRQVLKLKLWNYSKGLNNKPINGLCFRYTIKLILLPFGMFTLTVE